MTDEVEVKETVEQEQEDEKKAWDKTRQEVDQYKASVEKMSEEKAELQGQVETLQDTIEAERAATAEKLASIEEKLEAKAKAEDTKVDDIDSLDPDYVDAKVINALKSLKAQGDQLRAQLADKDKDLAALKQAKEAYEAEKAQSAEEQRKAALKESMLSDLDAEFGAKFRNDAVKLANDKVKKDGKAPEGDYHIFQFIRKCYKEIAEKAPKDTPKEPKVPVDTGAGSIGFKSEGLKEGSIDEVMKDLRSRYRGKGFSMPTT